MDVCIGLALGSALLLRLPSPIVLSWRHSVEQVELQEVWHAEAAGMVLRETAIEGPGAGIDLPAGARQVDGRWRFTPDLPAQPVVQLANSRFSGGYRVCWRGGCAPLAELIGGVDRPVTLRSCG